MDVSQGTMSQHKEKRTDQQDDYKIQKQLLSKWFINNNLATVVKFNIFVTNCNILKLK